MNDHEKLLNALVQRADEDAEMFRAAVDVTEAAGELPQLPAPEER